MEEAHTFSTFFSSIKGGVSIIFPFRTMGMISSADLILGHGLPPHEYTYNYLAELIAFPSITLAESQDRSDNRGELNKNSYRLKVRHFHLPTLVQEHFYSFSAYFISCTRNISGS